MNLEPISVIIPAYNEEASIGRVISEIRSILDACPHEIIVVNDASRDATEKEARAAGAKVFSNPANMGYGFSLKRGFSEATHECVIITDADGTYPAQAIPELVAEFHKGFDMVVGARQGKEYWSSVVKGIARVCFKLMSEFVVGKKIPDINSGFRVIRKSKIIPILPDLSNAFSFSTSSTLIFMLKGYFITYIPVTYHARTGVSKVNYVRDALRATQIMVDIIASYNPIKLFLFISFFPLLLSIIFLIGALSMQSLPALVLSTFSFMSALLFLSFGFMLTAFRRR